MQSISYTYYDETDILEVDIPKVYDVYHCIYYDNIPIDLYMILGDVN